MNLNGKWYSESELEAYISELKRLLRESQKVLIGAFFANHEYNKGQTSCTTIYQNL